MCLLSKRIQRTSSSWPSRTRKHAPHSMSHSLIVLSLLPLTTRRSRYWRQAIPRLWPLSVRTNSHVALNVPQSNRIVAAPTDHEAIAILETGDSTLVTAECAYEFARGRIPYFDSPVTTSRHYVLLVEIDDVHSRTVTNEDATKRYLRLRRHVPDGDRAVLGAGNHHAVVESEMQHRLAVMYQRIDHLASVGVPDSDCAVGRA